MDTAILSAEHAELTPKRNNMSSLNASHLCRSIMNMKNSTKANKKIMTTEMNKITTDKYMTIETKIAQHLNESRNTLERNEHNEAAYATPQDPQNNDRPANTDENERERNQTDKLTKEIFEEEPERLKKIAINIDRIMEQLMFYDGGC